MKKFTLLVLAAILFISACANDPDDSEQAEQALITFFDFMDRGQYDEAAELYGGGYETLVEFNPALDPGDRPALLKNGCEINGLQCLTVLTADFKQINAQGEYIFLVQFKDTDGNLFVQQTLNMPPVFMFEYRVRKTSDGKFVVLDLPVYVP